MADSQGTGWLSRLRAGLGRTRAQLAGVFGAGTRLDEALFEELEAALVQADTGVPAATALVETLRRRVRRDRIETPEALRSALQEEVAALLRPCQQAWTPGPERPCVVMTVGVNGSGKTTSIGKLAHWLVAGGRSVLLAAGDTFRAAAREQLAVWGERNGVEVIAQSGRDPAAVVFDAVSAARARGRDVVIADTAGRLPTQAHLMEELKRVRRAVDKALPGAPHEVLLVLDGTTGQNALAQVRAFDEAVGVTGLVVTKLDGTARGGVLVALANARPGRPLPIRFIGVGEGLADLQPFDADQFAQALLSPGG
jgi:fused signal recognition particle receptor